MESKNDFIRLAADLQEDSIVDGPGLRTVIWTQGCAHHCKGCQNPQTWDFEGGGLVPIEMVLSAIDELEYQKGITFSGGDPMYQPEACNIIAEYARSKGDSFDDKRTGNEYAVNKQIALMTIKYYL